ncbi:HNH endonuclease [Blastomonas sp.]|uniref:HNH endonuclease n=1 Tax=Blastomonas sp. TaxID=1909299 RepID=UPI00406A8956
MSLSLIMNYMKSASGDPSTVWNWDALAMSANNMPPQAILPRHSPMLLADTYAIWFRWFVEGMCNPLRYVADEKKTIVDVLADTIVRIDQIYSHEPQDEREELADLIARRVMSEVERHRRIERTHASTAQRQDLIDRAPNGPRCWVCGYAFDQLAIDKFLRRRKGITLASPSFVDILRPRGLETRDMGIEVEHIVPVAGGGGGDDNLALSCGWCNKNKGARTSIYDVEGRAPRSVYMLGTQQWLELPHPFWTVRILATRKRCEHHSGCSARSSHDELFIAPGDYRGAPNLNNLSVTCQKHDPYAVDRLMPLDQARQIWANRKRMRA